MDFNNDFAAKTWDLISKMDSDEAEMFVRFVAYDTLMEDIENNRRTIDRAVSEITQEIRKDLERVEDERTRSFAEAVSKAWGTNYEEKYHRPQNRDKSGRWSVTISREKNNVKNKKPKGAGDVRVGDFNLTSALHTTGEEMNEFQRRWQQRSDRDMSTTSGMYDRIGAGAHVLNEAGKRSGNAKLRLAGEAGEFFGKYGPQAEQVVGPHMRRTAYRYRGTERTPDAALVSTVKDEIGTIGRNEGLTSNSEFTPAMMNTASHRAAVKYLSQRLPSKNLSALQVASGKIPPSEGIMINADGKVIGQSVGYMDDHYLPFNLKNLKGLQGGSYVRTRSSGGLTTEDIYTGLVSGARSVTVVSRSGIFTVDFEDDFRGGRRFNDKAAGMIGRYAHTLDAVKSEQVVARPITAAERLQIREEVESDMIGYRHDEVEEEIKRRVTEARANPTISAAEMKEINHKAVEAASEGGQGPRGQFSEREWARIKDDPKKRILAYRQQMIEDLMLEKQSTKYQLDGEGYAAAQDALREQFPYYIARSTYIHNKDPRARGMGLSGEKDAGYVLPNYNRPEQPRAGYFDPRINGEGKRSAQDTNYQNWAVRQKAKAAEPDTPEEAEEKPKSKIAEAQKGRQIIANQQAENKANEEIKELSKLYMTQNVENKAKTYPLLTQLNNDTITIEELLGNSAKKAELEKEIKAMHADIGQAARSDEYKHLRELHNDASTRLRNIENFRATIGNRPFDPKKFSGEPSPRQAYTYEGEEYVPGSRADVYQEAWSKVNDRLGRNMGQQAGWLTPDMDDGRMRVAADRMGSMYKVAQQVASKEITDRNDILAAVSRVADPSLSAAQVEDLAMDVMNRADRVARSYLDSVDMIERARRIKIAAGDALTEKAPEKVHAASAAGSETVQGQVISSKPAKPDIAYNKRVFLAEVDQDSQDVDEDSELGGLLFSLNQGVSNTRLDEVKFTLEELAENYPDYANKYKKRLKELGLWMRPDD